MYVFILMIFWSLVATSTAFGSSGRGPEETEGGRNAAEVLPLVNYLGHMISKEGLCTSDVKVET